MDRYKYLTAFITAVLGIACIYYYMTVVYKGDNYRVLGGLGVMLVETMALLLLATILISFKKTKPAGHGVLIGTAVTVVIGFGICSSF